ncbi:hypothetical protein [Legionella gresilensis]|uniref:hypothetical protein n=1 Tax=Legionella gresilensis TaxID=91823 RepID=UPI0010413FEC|nr:hypothetical protein [Legionella gresilensis]
MKYAAFQSWLNQLKDANSKKKSVITLISDLEQLLAKAYNSDTIAQISEKLSDLNDLKPLYENYQVSISQILNLFQVQEERDEFVTTYPSFPEAISGKIKEKSPTETQTSKNKPQQQALLIAELKQRQKNTKKPTQNTTRSLEEPSIVSKAKSPVSHHNNRFMGKPEVTTNDNKDSKEKNKEEGAKDYTLHGWIRN